MNNHKKYNKVINNINYKVLEYINDNDNDYKNVNKFINNYINCIIIIKEFIYQIEDEKNYHPYYNPGFPLSKTIIYNNKEIIYEHLETINEYKTNILKQDRMLKLKKIKNER